MSATVLFTGGITSTVAATDAAQRGGLDALVYVQYRTENPGEMRAAKTIAEKLGARLYVPKMHAGGVEKALHHIESGRALHTGPDGPWDDTTRRAWDIPGVHLAMIGVAGTIAASLGSDEVAFGLSAESSSAFAAGTQEFLNAASYALGACAGDSLKRGAVVAPYLRATRAEVIQYGRRQGAPLADTWSCLRSRPLHCGTCPGCVTRQASFADADAELSNKARAALGGDPTRYATRA